MVKDRPRTDSAEGDDELAQAIRATAKAGPPGRNRPLTPEERIEAFRKIVSEWGATRMEGVLVDAFSASMVVQVYDKLTPENRVKFMSRPAKQVVLMGWKVVNASQGGR